MNTFDFLDRPIAFHRVFVEISGSIHAALLLSQSVYWTKRTKDRNGWFWKTSEEWTDETGMGRHEIARARKRLVGLGLVEYRVKGMPAKSYYRVCEDAINDAFKGHVRQLSVDQIIGLYEVELTQLSAAGFMRAKKMGRTAERVEYSEVLRKYGNICHRCYTPVVFGIGQSGAFLAFDHLKALAAGGDHTLENLRPIHARCNAQKAQDDKEDATLFSFLELSKLERLPQAGMSVGGKQPSNSTETTSETTPSAAGSGSKQNKLIPGHPLALRINAIFHRKATTPWTHKEYKAWELIAKQIKRDEAEAAESCTESELAQVERWYQKHWPPDRDKNTLRHNLIQFLNNYGGEVDKARPWCDRHRRPGTRKPVPTQPPPPPVHDSDPKATLEFILGFERNQGRLPGSYSRNPDGKIVGHDGKILAGQNGAH